MEIEMLDNINKNGSEYELNTLCQLLVECSHALNGATECLGYFNPEGLETLGRFTDLEYAQSVVEDVFTWAYDRHHYSVDIPEFYGVDYKTPIKHKEVVELLEELIEDVGVEVLYLKKKEEVA